jgi:uncharacterized protein (TIGR03084 family)
LLTQAIDLRAEADELHHLLAPLDDADWGRATRFKGWTINDIVGHLHMGDLMGYASATDEAAFYALRADIQAKRESGLTRLEDQRQRLGNLEGRALLARWYEMLGKLTDTLGARAPDDRLKWAGPDMGVRMFTTARQMETWAHGQAIFDVMGVPRQPTERLRNIAEIGVRTYGWTFANRGLPTPGQAPYVRLIGPSGAAWEWNEPAAGNAVEGSALEFCQVVTQVRNIADTALAVTGEPAQRWMALAQCFAGPPENPPPPGTRFMAPRPT